jgi:hypothetical protein
MNRNIYIHTFLYIFCRFFDGSVEPTYDFQWWVPSTHRWLSMGPIHPPTTFNGWWIFAVEIQWDSGSIEYSRALIQRSIH